MKYNNHTIYKRSDNRWSVTIKKDGKYKYIYGKTQEQCLNNLKAYLNELKDNKIIDIVTLNNWVSKWLEIYKSGKIKPNTLKSYNNIIKNHITNNIGNFKLSSFTPLLLQEHILKVSKATPRQAQKLYELLKDIFKKAYINKLINSDITEFLEKPKHIAKDSTFLNINQQKQFINYCIGKNTIYTDFLLVLLNQGLRISELKSLFINDINFEKKTLTINEKLDKKLYIKNKASNRTMPMLNNTYDILLKYKNCKTQLFNFSNTPIYNELKEINKSLNINISPHSLRHTFITRLKEKNVPEHVIQRLVGHTIGSAITSRIYTHNDNDFFNNLDLNF